MWNEETGYDFGDPKGIPNQAYEPSVRPDPRAPKRIKADQNEWLRLRAEKLGPCRLCHSFDSPTLHHILSKSLGGDDVAANLVPLCGSGTTGCHGKVEARDPWARTLLGERLKAAELAYVIGKKGAGWLELNYGVKAAA